MAASGAGGDSRSAASMSCPLSAGEAAGAVMDVFVISYINEEFILDGCLLNPTLENRHKVFCFGNFWIFDK